MSKLHIKFTVNVAMQESYCNTPECFYNTNNGRALNTLEHGLGDIEWRIRTLQSLASLMTNIDELEQRHKADTKHDCDAIMQEVISHIANVYKIEHKYLKPTKYTKNRQSVSFLMGTITVQVEK